MKGKIGIINYIWIGLLAIGILYAAFTGNISVVTEAAITSAENAVEICIGLVGVMCLWLGIMKIAEAGGVLQILGKLLRPIIVHLFPEIPYDHPAIGAMILNISANILGLGNAATPLGLKAMSELETLNRQHGTATNAMVLFLAINTSSITIIPATVIALRSAAGSTAPAEIIVPVIISSTISTLSAIFLCRLFGSFKKYRIAGNCQNVS